MRLLLHAVRERFQPTPDLRLLLGVLVHSNDKRADGGPHLLLLPQPLLPEPSALLLCMMAA